MKKKKYILPLAVLISVEDGEILAGSGGTTYQTESPEGGQPQVNPKEEENEEEETLAKVTSWTFSAGEDW